MNKALDDFCDVVGTFGILLVQVSCIDPLLFQQRGTERESTGCHQLPENIQSLHQKETQRQVLAGNYFCWSTRISQYI